MPRQQEGMSTATKVLLAGAAAGVVVGGVYLAFGRKSGSADNDDDFKVDASTSERMREPEAEKKKEPAATSSQKTASVSSEGKMSRADTSSLEPSYSFAATPENMHMLDEPKHHTGSRKEMPTQMKDGAKHFPRLGIVMQLPSGWNCKEEVPPVPSISMLSISKPEFEHQPPPMSAADVGRVPVCLVSIEDLSIEGLNAQEYLQKSKSLAFQQMMMMSQGMHAPQMVFEGEMKVGPFTLALEYAQITPMMQMQVLNLIAVECGFAYLLQFMAQPSVFEQYKSQIMECARGIELFPDPIAEHFGPTAYLDVKTGTHSLKIPPSWRAQPSGGIASFNSPSTAKTDAISIYTNDDDAVLTVLTGKEVAEKKYGDVTCTSIKDPSSQRIKKLYTNGTFAVVIQPLRSNNVSVLDTYCVEVLQSIQPCTEPKATWYVSPARNLKFQLLREKAVVLETRVGDGAILFAPEGLGDQGNPDAGAPAMTIRVEDPSTDQDCEGSLDEWYARIDKESADGTLTELKRTKLGGKDAVSFISKEMVEVGPGQREERVAKIVIFVHNGKTNMLRWEASTANFRRTQPQFEGLLDTYTFLS